MTVWLTLRVIHSLLYWFMKFMNDEWKYKVILWSFIFLYWFITHGQGREETMEHKKITDTLCLCWQCQCQFILVNLIHSTCLDLRAIDKTTFQHIHSFFWPPGPGITRPCSEHTCSAPPPPRIWRGRRQKSILWNHQSPAVTFLYHS